MNQKTQTWIAKQLQQLGADNEDRKTLQECIEKQTSDAIITNIKDQSIDRKTSEANMIKRGQLIEVFVSVALSVSFY